MPSQLPFAVLWDLDGTLIDSEEYWMLAEQQLAARYPGDWNHSDGLELVGLSLYESSVIMKQKMKIHDLEPQAIIDELTESVIGNLRKAIPWRPGAKELLQELKGSGVKTAMVTMSMSRMALEVAAAIDFDAFDVVLGGDQVEQGKPHPEPYLKAASMLGFEPARCIAFEDSLNGLRSAEAAGTVAVGIPNVIDLPQQEGRIIWPTLEGVSIELLTKLFD
jgi:HAD superfamily hydrolase (TIGR01509 family)